MSLVTISDSAVTYLQDLLNSQEEETNIKIFVSDPGTMRAETCIVYCKVGEEEEDDVLMEVEDLSVYLENESLPFLEDCKVDYHPDDNQPYNLLKMEDFHFPDKQKDPLLPLKHHLLLLRRLYNKQYMFRPS